MGCHTDTDGRTDGRSDGRTDGPMNDELSHGHGRSDGRTDEPMNDELSHGHGRTNETKEEEPKRIEGGKKSGLMNGSITVKRSLTNVTRSV